MEKTMNEIISRRNALRITFGGGAMLLSGCVSPDMMGAAVGGAGKEANWAALIKEARDAIDLVANQALKLEVIQREYATVLELKDLAAQIQLSINNKKTGNVNNVSFIKSSAKLTKTAQKAINKEIARKGALNSQQKKVLANGLVKHQKTIQNAWVGGIKMAKVLVDARSAKKPSFKDMEAVGYLSEIITNVPTAIGFLTESKKTYEVYAEAFEYKAKVPVKASQRKLELKPFAMS